MEKTEQKWLKEIRDNTKQLERIAKRLDVISRQLDRLDRKTEPNKSDIPTSSTGYNLSPVEGETQTEGSE